MVSDGANSATRQCASFPDCRGLHLPVWVDTRGYDDSADLSDQAQTHWNIVLIILIK